MAVRDGIGQIGLVRVLHEFEVVLDDEKRRVRIDEPKEVEEGEKEGEGRRRMTLHRSTASVTSTVCPRGERALPRVNRAGAARAPRPVPVLPPCARRPSRLASR